MTAQFDGSSICEEFLKPVEKKVRFQKLPGATKKGGDEAFYLDSPVVLTKQCIKVKPPAEYLQCACR